MPSSARPQQPPPQHQAQQPGREHEMTPRPQAEDRDRPGCGRLEGRVAIVTGGDSGIGRVVAMAFAKEGAHVAIVYLEEHKDAEDTRRRVEAHGRRALLLAGDLGRETFCREVVEKTVKEFGRLDIVVNNAAEQHVAPSLDEITEEQLERTFLTNIFGMFFLTKAALPHLGEGAAIVNTTSVTSYKGSPHDRRSRIGNRQSFSE